MWPPLKFTEEIVGHLCIGMMLENKSFFDLSQQRESQLKSYADCTRRYLEFKVKDYFFLKVYLI